MRHGVDFTLGALRCSARSGAVPMAYSVYLKLVIASFKRF